MENRYTPDWAGKHWFPMLAARAAAELEQLERGRVPKELPNVAALAAILEREADGMRRYLPGDKNTPTHIHVTSGQTLYQAYCTLEGAVSPATYRNLGTLLEPIVKLFISAAARRIDPQDAEKLKRFCMTLSDLAVLHQRRVRRTLIGFALGAE